MSDLAENFSKVSVLVVGDLMLDRYWWGSVERISPEAPVPVVRLEKESLAPGGAANVAVNIKGLGAHPVLCGITGNDPAAELLREHLEDLGIRTDKLIKTDRPTTMKTRIVAHSQQVVRIDQEDTSGFSGELEDLIWNEIEKTLPETDVVLVSDYSKGIVTGKLCTRLITAAKELKKKVIIDPKGKDYEKYRSATILTPNQREAFEAHGSAQQKFETIEKTGSDLVENLDLEGLVITRGEKGMIIFEPERPPLSFKASARQVFDVTGAGDTVIAVLATAIGAGLGLEQAARLANTAAGLVVEQVGTTAIDMDMLQLETGSLAAI